MNCDRVGELMLEYAAGKLPGDTRRAVEEHLKSCPACQREAHDLIAIAKAIANDPPIQTPEHEIAACVRIAEAALVPATAPARTRRRVFDLGDYAFGIGSLAVFVLAAVMSRLLGWNLSLGDVIEFVRSTPIAIAAVVALVALVTCFVPIVVFAQRSALTYRAVAYRKGG
jgi:anti-sigma factor RsiW